MPDRVHDQAVSIMTDLHQRLKDESERRGVSDVEAGREA